MSRRRVFRGPVQSEAMTDPLTGRQVFPKQEDGPRYRIKRNGELVEVSARHSDRGWALRDEDHLFAEAVAFEIEKACIYFHKPEAEYPFNPEFSVLTQEEVRARVFRLDQGEHKREAKNKRFPLCELPIEWQVALIANLDQLAFEHGFEKLEPSA